MKMKMKMKKVISFTYCIAFCTTLSSQKISSNDMRYIQNNIVAYHIFKLAENDYRSGIKNYNFDEFRVGHINLLMDAHNLTLAMNFNLISLFNDFQDKSYQFFEITINNFTYFDSINGNGISLLGMNYYFLPHDEKYLIAKKNDQLLFISGNFFKSKLSNFFIYPVGKSDIELIIRLKFYNYNIKSVEKIILKRTHWEVNFLTDENHLYEVKIKRNDIDNLMISKKI